MRMHNPPHPGLVLKDALEGIPMTVTDFARHIGIARVSLSRILNGHAGITAAVSIKLSEAFGQKSPELWFKMQNYYDFWQASQAKRKKVRPVKVARQLAA